MNPKEAKSPARAARASKVPSGRILVIDDDSVIRSLLRKLLEVSKPPFQVEEATDGAQAKHLVSAVSYDCLVLDHLLPDMTGLEFLRWLRGRDTRTPVIVFTAMGDEALAVEMMKAGATDYLSKAGFSSERFHDAVRKACDASRVPRAR